MADWIIVPDNQSFDGIPQGVEKSKNPKDYVREIRKKEQEESKVETSTETIIIKPTQVKLNDVSEITNRRRNVYKGRTG